jgi:hypothetical protein
MVAQSAAASTELCRNRIETLLASNPGPVSTGVDRPIRRSHADRLAVPPAFVLH